MDDLETILDLPRNYESEAPSMRSLEDTIRDERNLQSSQVEQLSHFRDQTSAVQNALETELRRFKDLNEELERTDRKSKGVWSWLPWAKSNERSRKSIEDLLRQQYETSLLRLREAADFADRLEVARVELYDELDRLNQKIVDSAVGEETAASYVTELQEMRDRLELELVREDLSSSEARTLQMMRDKTRRLLAEHTTKFKLYATAEDRLATLRENTRQLAEMIGHLQSDITRYVTAASEKLDLISGQIQAIGAAADAASVMLELRESLNIMTESMNQATRFVVETQRYFRDNVDTMIDELELYDEKTVLALESANINAESMDEVQIETILSELDSDEVLSAKIEALAVAKQT